MDDELGRFSAKVAALELQPLWKQTRKQMTGKPAPAAWLGIE
jgi:hypothetical protein